MGIEKKIDYSKILKSGSAAVSFDNKVFNAYNDGKLSLRECFEWFMKNSVVGGVNEKYWDPTQFRLWLKSLGYSRFEHRHLNEEA